MLTSGSVASQSSSSTSSSTSMKTSLAYFNGHKKSVTANPFKWVRQKSDSDAPKKPLSSYNIYFLLERDRIVSGEEEERMYSTEDVRNIVEQQKWNNTYRKRQHRKTHGKVSFHDLSRVVANNWRQLSEEQKAVFNHQASIEKKEYKQTLNAWVMKQMKQGQPLTSEKSLGSVERDLRTPIHTQEKVHENKNVNHRIMTTVDDEHIQLLSNEEADYLLECLNMTPLSNLASTYASNTNTTSTCQVNHHNNDTYQNVDVANDWMRLDVDGPLWYEGSNLNGCSEEFALQMVNNNYYQLDDTTMHRSITM